VLWRLTTGWRRFSGTAGNVFDPLRGPRMNRPIGVAEARAEPVVSRIQRRHDRHFRRSSQSPFDTTFLALATTISLLRYATRQIHYADTQLRSDCMMQILQTGKQTGPAAATKRSRRTPMIASKCTYTANFLFCDKN